MTSLVTEETERQRWGSKLRRVLDVLQELCKVGERVVIFAQSPEQARFMGVRLGEELLCHILEGPSHRRCQILRSFHQMEASSLICLVDEVDGMNLQCAAHIFFVYPATSEVERGGSTVQTGTGKRGGCIASSPRAPRGGRVGAQ